MRVIQPGNSRRLTLKKASRFLCSLAIGIRRSIRADHLDRYLLADACIFCKVNFTHPATTELTNEAIATNLLFFERHFSPRERNMVRLREDSRIILKNGEEDPDAIHHHENDRHSSF
jgi:hypothetical protein